MCCSLLCRYSFDFQVNQAADGLNSNYGALIDLLQSIEHCLKQIDIYTRIPPTPALDEMVFNTILGLLSTLAFAMIGLQEARSSESVFANMLPLLREKQSNLRRKKRRSLRRSRKGSIRPQKTELGLRPSRSSTVPSRI
jgi:hypothetical protein